MVAGGIRQVGGSPGGGTPGGGNQVWVPREHRGDEKRVVPTRTPFSAG